MSQSPESASSGSESDSPPSVGPPKQAVPLVTPDVSGQQQRGRPTRPRTSRTGSSESTKESSISKQTDDHEYPPDDARAMSPRRGSEETEVLGEAARTAVREKARQLQLNLLEIAERIELVKADAEKLEKHNLALQDYIGGLTRSMSQGQVPKGTKVSAK